MNHFTTVVIVISSFSFLASCADECIDSSYCSASQICISGKCEPDTSKNHDKDSGADLDADTDADTDTDTDTDIDTDTDTDEVDTDSPVACAVESFYSVWGRTADDVYIGGSCGRIAHFDGDKWTPNIIETGDSIYRIWGVPGGSTYAVAGRTYNASKTGLEPGGPTVGTIFRNTNKTWDISYEYIIEERYENVSGAGDYGLMDIWGTSDNFIFAVGGKDIFHFNGSSWSVESTGPCEQNRAIWGSSADDIYVGGIPFRQLDIPGSCDALHYDGTNWTGKQITSYTTDIFDIFGIGKENMYIVGSQGQIEQYNGIQAKNLNQPKNLNFHGGWAFSNSSLYIAGENGTIAHYDGTKWSVVTTPTTETLWSIWGSAENDIYAVGDDMTVVHFDGASWSFLDPCEDN
jgi:hypothetical protein